MPAREATPFSQALDRRVVEGALGTLYDKLPDESVRCYACAHRCLIKERRRGFMTAYISNGNATREVLDFIRPWTDLYKIDLKSFRDKNYRSLGGKLDNILNGIRMVHAMGFWLEIVTLIIPGFNDSDEELGDIARFLAGLSPTIPWHVTGFHKDYRMQEPDNTTTATLLRAARIGEAAGLQYVYAGDIPGSVGDYEDTRCPN